MDISSIPQPTQVGTLSNGATVKSASQAGNASMSDFFKILAAQLQYQDPSQQTSNTEYMGEMAQFSTLTAVQDMTKKIGYDMGANLVGQKVSFNYADDSGKTQSSAGEVEAVNYSSDDPMCYINGQWVTYSNIKSVYAQDVSLTGK